MRGRFLSLGAKMSLAVVLAIAVGTIVLGVKWTADARQSIVATKRASAVMLTEMLSLWIAPAIEFGDNEDLDHAIGQLRSRADVVNASAWSLSSNTPVVSLDHGDADNAPPNRPAVQSTVEEDDGGLTVVRPAYGPAGVVGTVSVRFSLAPENAAFRKDRWRIVAVASAFGASLSAFVLLMLRIIVVRPLQTLTIAARSLERGESPRVRVRAHDEVGVLAHAFNSMVFVIDDRERKLAAANRELQDLSLTDPLTGLRNRRFFASAVEHEVHLLRRTHSRPPSVDGERNRDMVVYIVDLDHFKKVNDAHGHAAGDAVLKEAAKRLLQSVRQSDMVIRWGGEEFMIVARRSERREGVVLADRVLRNVAGQPFELPSGAQITVSCSVGWSPFPWRDGGYNDLSLEQVVQLADRALYVAKARGRNRAAGVTSATGSIRGSAWLDANIEALDGTQLALELTLGPTSQDRGEEPTPRGMPAGLHL